MKPNNRLISQEEWNEEEHPRGQPDNAGQFVAKSSGDSVRKSHKDSVIQGQIDYLKGMIKEESQQYTAFQKVTDEDRSIRWRNNQIKEQIKKLEEEMAEPDLEGLPEIKEKPNTHKEKTFKGGMEIMDRNGKQLYQNIDLTGFKANNTTIRVKMDLNREYDHSTRDVLERQINTIKLVWNNFPDEVRDSIKDFRIERRPELQSSVDGMKITYHNMDDVSTLGFWAPSKKEFVIRIDGDINDKDLKATVTHESGHVMWHSIKDKNPEKLENWKKQTAKLSPPTAYSKVNKKRWDYYKETFAKYEKEGWEQFDKDNSTKPEHNKTKREIAMKNVQIMEDRYYNELHSEVHMYMMGHTKTKTKTGKITKTMEKFAGAYKELHEL